MSVDPDFVVCVVVTHDRTKLLMRSLAVLASQSRPPDHLVVVDNAPNPSTAQAVAGCGLPHTYLPSQTNLGGGGGFAYGVLTARALGADWVWLADDDGRPGERTTLSTLLRCADDRGWDAVSPLVVADDHPDRLAFPLRRGRSWVRVRADLAAAEVIDGVAQLFNGALVRARAFDTIGVPDSRLFVRGDEVEVHRRLVRSGLSFGTCLGATYRHPSGADDFVPIMGGRAVVYLPADPARADIALRNQGYLTSLPGMRWRRLPDEVRYGWYFLAAQRDPRAWWRWRQRRAEGRRERFPQREVS